MSEVRSAFNFIVGSEVKINRLNDVGNIINFSIVPSDEFDIDEFVLDNRNTDEDIFVSFEEYDVLGNFDFSIKQVSSDRSEMMIEIPNSNVANSFENIIEDTIKDRSLEVFKGDSYNQKVVGYSRKENMFIIVLQQQLNRLNRNDNIIFKILSKKTEDIRIRYNIDRSVENFDTTLTGHRKEGLNNFEGQSDRSEVFKKYGDIKNRTETFKAIENINQRIYTDIDLSSFENFVRFSSATSKVQNMLKKLDEIITLEDRIEKYKSSQGQSERNIRDVEQRLENKIKNLNYFELYVYRDIYSEKTNQEFEEWYEQTEQKAKDYDLQNTEFILLRVPEDFLEEDRSGIFTNYLLAIGESFDYFWMLTKMLVSLKNFDFSYAEQMSKRALNDTLKQLGLESNIDYSDKKLSDYFTGKVNFSELSKTISRRMVYSLPFLFKGKGTVPTIREILNVFGVQNNLISIYENGGVKYDTERKFEKNEKLWFLNKTSQNNISLNIDQSDLQTPFTVVMYIKNLLSTSGILVNFGSDTYIRYVIDSNDRLIFEFVVDNTVVQQTAPTTINNQEWSVLSFGFDSNNIYVNIAKKGDDRDIYFAGKFEQKYTLPSEFSEINFLSSVAGAVHSIKLFSGILSQSEFVNMVGMFRSVATFSGESLIDIYFEPPQNSYFESADPDTTPLYEYNPRSVFSFYPELKTVFITNLQASQFDRDNVTNVGFIKTLPDMSLSSSKGNILEQQEFDTLSSEFRKTNYFDDNYLSRVSIFISPIEFVNKAIIEKFGEYEDFVPHPFESGFTTFSTLVSKSTKVKNLTSVEEYNLSNFISLYKLLNANVFNVIREFIPASVYSEMGLLIKNNIVDKSRGFHSEKTFVIDQNSNALLSKMYKSHLRAKETKQDEINVGNLLGSATAKIDPKIDGIFVTEDNSEGAVLTSITSLELIPERNEFYNTAIIKGNQTLIDIIERIDLFEDAGAVIQVKGSFTK